MRSKGIINGYRLFDESISDLLEFNWRNYDLPNMLAQGIKVPLKNVKDFIDFMKNEGREYLIPSLPGARRSKWWHNKQPSKRRVRKLELKWRCKPVRWRKRLPWSKAGHDAVQDCTLRLR